jgi:hypothetical protein
MSMSELVQGGLDTDTLESKIRRELMTNPKWIAKIDRSLATVEESKRETMRELLIETYLCDLVLASHAYEAGF